MPNQTPEPPRVTDGQIAEWEKLAQYEMDAKDPSTCLGNAARLLIVIAEVKRLKATAEADAIQRRLMQEEYEALTTTICDHCEKRVPREDLDLRWDDANICTECSLDMIAEEAKRDVESRAPRTTERL